MSISCASPLPLWDNRGVDTRDARKTAYPEVVMKENSIELTLATEDDARVIWTINNEPSTRQRSVQSGSIPWEEHLRWYMQSLESETRVLFLARVGEDVIGTLRLELDDMSATISIALAPDARGQGYGRRLIRTCCDVAAKQYGRQQVIALIRPDNVASLKAFGAAGFESDGQVTQHDVLLKRMVWQV